MTLDSINNTIPEKQKSELDTIKESYSAAVSEYRAEWKAGGKKGPDANSIIVKILEENPNLNDPKFKIFHILGQGTPPDQNAEMFPGGIKVDITDLFNKTKEKMLKQQNAVDKMIN